MKRKVLDYLKKFNVSNVNVNYAIAPHNNQLTVIGYFHQLTEIKRNLFNNSDYVIISKTSSSLFKLTTLIN